MKTKRVLIVSDGEAWFVRRVRSTVHDLSADEIVYFCDRPIGGRHASLEEATEALRAYLRPRKKAKREA